LLGMALALLPLIGSGRAQDAGPAPGWTFHLLLAVGLAGMPAAAQGARRFGALEFSPCALSSPGLPLTVPAQCTSVTVPEDHARPGGRRIELALAWVPSTARKPEPDPVFMLAGGPGQSARDSYAAVSPAFREVLRRDLAKWQKVVKTANIKPQ